MAKKKLAHGDEEPIPPSEAKDEMNLAEFPISLLSDRPPDDVKSIVFEDTTFDSGSNRLISRKLTITAPAKHGLPRGVDEDVIVALIQLTKLKNGFSNRKVRFTRSELIDLLGWPYNGKSYDRLTASLKRWTVASLEYDNAWWVKSEQRWTSKVFHILDECEINDSRSSKGQRQFLTSEIHWNETVFNSFASGNLKDLDYRLYLGLEYATSKRMFRFLDKRLYRKTEMTFDLKDFAFAHIGLSRGYEKNAGKIKEKLRPAIKELIEAGFLEPMGDEERFVNDDSEWKVVFRRAGLDSTITREDESAGLIVQELIERDVSPGTARQLAENFPAETVRAQVDAFDWLVEKKDKRVSKSPSGYLVKSIQDGYAIPKGSISRIDREADRKVIEARADDANARKAAKAEKEAERRAILAHWEGLNADQRDQSVDLALEAAPPESREFYEAQPRYSSLRKLALVTIRDDYIRTIIGR